MSTCLLVLCAALALGQPAAEDESLGQIGLPGESGRTGRRLAATDKLVAEKNWPEAVDELQSILNEAGDDLVPLSTRHCVQARYLCHLRLAALPPEGLRLYRNRVDGQASKWLEEGRATRDVRLLRRIVHDSFCSKVTDQTLDLLGDLAFERGAFEEAERWWRLLARPASELDRKTPGKDVLVFPDPQVDEARARAKQLLARLFAGDPAGFREEWRAFQQRHGGASGHLAGRDGNYVHILKALADKAADVAPGATVEAWRTFAGDPSRNFILPRATGRLDRLPQPDAPEWQVRLPLAHEDDARLVAADAQRLAFYPVIVGDRVLVADPVHVRAHNLLDRTQVWNYDLHDKPQNGEANDSLTLPAEPYANYTLTATDECVYARLGAVSMGPRRGDNRSFLVCLNMQPGSGVAQRWRVEPKSAGRGSAIFEGAPLVYGSRVYMAVTTLDAVQTQTAIACYHADSGDQLWQRDICDTLELKDSDRRFRHHLLTLAGDKVVYCSHSGAIVAVDADSGQRIWAVRYGKPRTKDPTPSRRGLAPCVYAGGRLFVAPADFHSILCLDAETGHQLWESTPLEVTHLLGVARGHLVCTAVMINGGTGTVLQHLILALRVANGNAVWVRPGEGFSSQDLSGDQDMLATVGRGLLAGDRVYWPTTAGLIVLDQASGEYVASDPRIQGNLAAANGSLVAAGMQTLTVYLPTGRQVKPPGTGPQP